MDKLDKAVVRVLDGPEQNEFKRAALLYEYVLDLGLSAVNVRDCRELLRDAQASGEALHGWGKDENHVPMVIGSGQPLWGQLLLSGGINLLTAAPKVGKSALIVHFIACVFRGDQTCLGEQIHQRFDHVVIAGTDMDLGGWVKIFVREGLASVDAYGRLIWLDKRITLFHSGVDFQLSSSGCSKLREECAKHSNSLLLLDTLRSVTSQLGLDEYKPEIVRPLYALRNAIAGLSVTTVVNHHENKSGTGLGSVSGSSAIVGAMDAIVSMKWVQPVSDGLDQIDKRRLLSSTGRLDGQSLVCELDKDEQWITHGSGEQVIRAEARFKAMGELQGRDQKVFEVVDHLWEQEQFSTMSVIKERCSLNRKMAENVVNKLIRKGLIQKDGTLTPQPGMSGRPATRYRPVEEEGENASDVGTSVGQTPLNKGFSHSPPLSHAYARVREAETQLPKGLKSELPALGTLVDHKGKPALVLEHRGVDLMVTKAIKIRDQWIAEDQQRKQCARWGIDANEFVEPTQPVKACGASHKPSTSGLWQITQQPKLKLAKGAQADVSPELPEWMN